MGRKVNPKSFRMGNLFIWGSRWFADKNNYRNYVLEDKKIRDFLMGKLKPAGVGRVEIERSINKITVIVFVAKPGLVIGRGGTGLEDIKKQLTKLISSVKVKVELRIEGIAEPYLDAYLVARNISDMLGKRMMAKRIIGQMLEKIMAAGARGARVKLAGRINGAEIARVEKGSLGVLPLSTMRENIDFAEFSAHTRSGYIGVKVWICKKRKEENASAAAQETKI